MIEVPMSSRTAAMDSFLSGRMIGGETFQSVSNLTDSGRARVALELPVDAGTRVVFSGGLGLVLPDALNQINPGAKGVVIQARTATGASTATPSGEVFVRWDTGKLSKVPHTMLKAERVAVKHASSFTTRMAMLSAFQVLSTGLSSAYGVTRREALDVLRKEGIGLRDDAHPPEGKSLEEYLKWAKGHQRLAASTIAKATDALIKYLNNLRLGDSIVITDIARHPTFRLLHFSHIMKAVDFLARKGQIESDGVILTRVASTTDNRIKVAHVGCLDEFLKVGNNTLVQKATRDLWSLSQSENGYVIERLFDDNGKPLKA
jgi:hypothetical protein